MRVSVGDVRGLAKMADDFAHKLCPYLAVMFFLMLLGLVFGLGNVTFLVIFTRRGWADMRIFLVAITLWIVFNIIFNYTMACLVPPGSPQDIPICLLSEISMACRKCGGIKPPRSHHCSICDRCVMQMDRKPLCSQIIVRGLGPVWDTTIANISITFCYMWHWVWE